MGGTLCPACQVAMPLVGSTAQVYQRWTCNRCWHLGVREARYHCAGCHFDQCQECQVPRFGRFSCHQCREACCVWDRGTWECDVCGYHGIEERRWTCFQCDFDKCIPRCKDSPPDKRFYGLVPEMTRLFLRGQDLAILLASNETAFQSALRVKTRPNWTGEITYGMLFAMAKAEYSSLRSNENVRAERVFNRVAREAQEMDELLSAEPETFALHLPAVPGIDNRQWNRSDATQARLLVLLQDESIADEIEKIIRVVRQKVFYIFENRAVDRVFLTSSLSPSYLRMMQRKNWESCVKSVGSIRFEAGHTDTGGATGWIIDQDCRYVITNCHVAVGAERSRRYCQSHNLDFAMWIDFGIEMNPLTGQKGGTHCRRNLLRLVYPPPSEVSQYVAAYVPTDVRRYHIDVAIFELETPAPSLSPLPFLPSHSSATIETASSPFALIGYPGGYLGSVKRMTYLLLATKIFEVLKVKRCSLGALMLTPSELTDPQYTHPTLATVRSMGAGRKLKHDAITLKGNSGSAMLFDHLNRVVVGGLHFGGREDVHNLAVSTQTILHVLSTDAACRGIVVPVLTCPTCVGDLEDLCLLRTETRDQCGVCDTACAGEGYFCSGCSMWTCLACAL